MPYTLAILVSRLVAAGAKYARSPIDQAIPALDIVEAQVELPTEIAGQAERVAENKDSRKRVR